MRRSSVFLQNQWVATSEVTATLATENPYAWIRSNQTEFAVLPTGQKVDNLDDPFEVDFDASTPIGAEILFDLTLEGNDGYLGNPVLRDSHHTLRGRHAANGAPRFRHSAVGEPRCTTTTAMEMPMRS